MKLRTMIGWWVLSFGAAVAAPGEVDMDFSPGLRAEAAAGAVVADDGRILVSGGFSWVNGVETGDWVELGPDGELLGEPVPGLLHAGLAEFSLPFGFGWEGRAWGNLDQGTWFPLEGGGWLVPAGEGGWLRSEDGEPAFPGLAEGDSVMPQFERDGRIWVVRRSGGVRTLEARWSGSGEIDPAFTPGPDWPDQPLAAVPGPGTSVWVLGGEPGTFFFDLFWSPPEVRMVFRVDENGAIDEAAGGWQVPDYRFPRLFEGKDGGYRVQLDPHASRNWYWPAPESHGNGLRWFSADGELVREQEFWVKNGNAFLWVEDAEGNVLASGYDGALERFFPDGLVDESFSSPGHVSDVRALPDGKWLVDGTRRLLADGGEDETWERQAFERRGTVLSIQAMSGGRVLVAGDFTRVNGMSRHGVAVFHADGSLDESFVPDERLRDVRSAAVSGETVYVVTLRPVESSDGKRSNLVKLGADGSMDEEFLPRTSATHPISWTIGGSFSLPLENPTPLQLSLGADAFTKVHGHPDGGVFAESRPENWYFWPGESLIRLLPDGIVNPGFERRDGGEQLLVLGDGRFVISHEIYGADGSLLERVGSGLSLRPLCEWRGGVLFGESFGNSQVWGQRRMRLRLWRDDGWVTGFARGPLNANSSILATAGGGGSLYFQEDRSLVRMGENGPLDLGFDPAAATSRVRVGHDGWKVVGTAGWEEYEPPVREARVAAMFWHPEEERLWIGGNFSHVDGLPRQGLAWLDGSGEAPAGTPFDAFAGWKLGFGLEDGDEDPDGDGLPNRIEFLTGGDPTMRSEGPSFWVEEGEAVFRYLRSGEAIGETAVVEISTDLDIWTPAEEESTGDGPGDSHEVIVRVPMEGEPKMFMRLRAGE